MLARDGVRDGARSSVCAGTACAVACYVKLFVYAQALGVIGFYWALLDVIGI